MDLESVPETTLPHFSNLTDPDGSVARKLWEQKISV
jgi:hypothetical protein